MTRLLVTCCTFVFGTIGWYAGAPFGALTAFVLSILGTAAGVYLGRQLAHRWGA